MASKARSCHAASVAFTIYSATCFSIFFLSALSRREIVIQVFCGGWISRLRPLLSWAPSSCRTATESISARERGGAPRLRVGRAEVEIALHHQQSSRCQPAPQKPSRLGESRPRALKQC